MTTKQKEGLINLYKACERCIAEEINNSDCPVTIVNDIAKLHSDIELLVINKNKILDTKRG